MVQTRSLGISRESRSRRLQLRQLPRSAVAEVEADAVAVEVVVPRRLAVPLLGLRLEELLQVVRQQVVLLRERQQERREDAVDAAVEEDAAAALLPLRRLRRQYLSWICGSRAA